MRFAVTGSSGFVGRHLVQRLVAAGHEVACISRHGAPEVRGTVSWGVNDYRDESSLARAFAGAQVVIHLAARAHAPDLGPGPAADRAWHEANVLSALAAARAAKSAGCRRFVLVSSIGVNGNRTSGRPFTADDTPAPQEAYARSKLQAEQAVWQLLLGGDTAAVVVRPPLVYGPGCPGNFAQLVRLVQRWPIVPLGGLRQRRSLIGVHNLCGALVSASTHPDCPGHTFVLCDGEDVDVATLTRLIAVGLGLGEARIVDVPQSLLRGAARLLGRGSAFDKLAGELLVDGSAFCKLTGWQAALTLADGVKATARSFAPPFWP